MKKIITSLFALIVLNTTYGQGHFDVGSNVIGVGIGLGSSYGSGFTTSSQTPAINLQFEHGMWSAGGPGVISLGGYVGFKNYTWDYSGYSEKWNYTIIGVRSAYHYNGITSDKFDVYGGLMLGVRIVSFSDSDPNYVALVNYGSTDLVLYAYVGGRYYFSDNFAGFAELGNGLSILNLGVAFKF